MKDNIKERARYINDLTNSVRFARTHAELQTLLFAMNQVNIDEKDGPDIWTSASNFFIVYSNVERLIGSSEGRPIVCNNQDGKAIFERLLKILENSAYYNPDWYSRTEKLLSYLTAHVNSLSACRESRTKLAINKLGSVLLEAQRESWGTGDNRIARVYLQVSENLFRMCEEILGSPSIRT